MRKVIRLNDCFRADAGLRFVEQCITQPYWAKRSFIVLEDQHGVRYMVWPLMIYTPFSEAELDDQFHKAKPMELNCLHMHIKFTCSAYRSAPSHWQCQMLPSAT